MGFTKDEWPSPESTAHEVSRRSFLTGAGKSALSMAGVSGLAAHPDITPSSSAGYQTGPVIVPAHLPAHLTITLWIRGWLMAVAPGEPYHDLERAIAETAERGFNTIRPEVALNWCFDRHGKPRGAVDVSPWVAGLSDNFRGYNGSAGVRYDALERILTLYELAKKYRIYIIQTSWEYQDDTPLLSDSRLRDEIYSTPREDRFERLADMHDRLIQELKKNGLEKQIAFVEIHNELNASDFPSGLSAQKPLVEKALHRLQRAHPDILFTADYVNVGPCFDGHFPGYDVLPNNLQVADHHIYAGGVEDALLEKLGTSRWNQVVPDPGANPLLQWLIGEKPSISWEEWTERAQRIPKTWWPVQWLYANLKSPDRYDYWMYEHFGQYAAMMKRVVQTGMREWGTFARSRGLPAVIDEGYFGWPPLNSRFEESAAIRQMLEFVVDTAIEEKYWGMMITTYCAPDEPIWTENPKWLRQNNERFLSATNTQSR